MKPRILAASKIHDKAVEKAKEFADIDVKTGLSEEELVGVIAEYDAIVVRSKPKVTKAIIEAGKKLKVIGRAGVGLDNIDQEAAKAKGVDVVNSPEASTISVAEHAIGLMISLLRKVPKAERSLRSGQWDRKSFVGNELYGKTLGIVGFGRIGREVALRGRAFGLNIIVYDPAITSEDAKEFNAETRKLEDLMAEADIVSLHVPAIEATEDMINEKTLGLMKETSILVNTSRGHALDEEALYKVLKDNKIAGAAVDVYKNEPPGDIPLLGLDNIIVVPHLGANTDEAQINAGTVVIEKIRNILSSK